jgi:hypothetical protein
MVHCLIVLEGHPGTWVIVSDDTISIPFERGTSGTIIVSRKLTISDTSHMNSPCDICDIGNNSQFRDERTNHTWSLRPFLVFVQPRRSLLSPKCDCKWD